jgi:hypothetical protein
MKKILTIALLFVGVALFAQASTTASQPTQAPVLNAKTKELCKKWSLSMTENFGDQHKPTEKQANDVFLLMESGRYRLIMDGAAEGGTWTISKDNLWITLTNDSGAIKKFKVLESTATSLKVDYRDADDIHNILIYSVAQ